MYRDVNDFIEEWQQSAAGTLQVFEAMTDEKLDQAIAEGHNTLGWLAWHLTNTPVFFGQILGLQITPAGDRAVVPTSAAEIVAAYKQVMADVTEEAKKLSNETLLEELPAFGTTVKKGAMLRKLVDHQTHHRGQMTVLLRQADLAVPGIMGPTKEAQAK